MRVVLVGPSQDDWRIYRQPQWIGKVRARPEWSTLPRRHFDMDESAYRTCLGEWEKSGASRNSNVALALLAQHGAAEVTLR